MADLPDVAHQSAYEEMPIENFGEAMLRGKAQVGLPALIYR